MYLRYYKYFLFLALATPLSARAALGEVLPPEPENSGGQVTEKMSRPFRRLESGTEHARVRQFASMRDNRVFAVTWTGRRDEKVHTLLGVYKNDLHDYEQNHPPRAGRIHYRKVDAGRVVFEFWDLPKMVKGRAYLPAQMPAGVSTEDF